MNFYLLVFEILAWFSPVCQNRTARKPWKVICWKPWGALELVECPPAPAGSQPFIGAVHEDIPRKIYLERKDTFIGRDQYIYNACEQQKKIDLPTISGMHCRISLRREESSGSRFVRGGIIRVELLDTSRFGTFVNWELVGKGNKCLLKDGDEIVLYMGQMEPPSGITLQSAVNVQHRQIIMYRLSITEDNMDEAICKEVYHGARLVQVDNDVEEYLKSCSTCVDATSSTWEGFDVVFMHAIPGQILVKAVQDSKIDDFESTLKGLLVERIMVNVQALLTSVKAQAAKLESVVVKHGRETYPLMLTVCGPRGDVKNLLAFANELVPQFPQTWTSIDTMLTSDDEVLLVELNKRTSEYQNVVGQLDSKDKEFVLGIKRVQHPGHYKQNESLFKQYGGARKSMWHGTNLSAVPGIVERGFNRSFHNVCTYGKGVYMHTEASYCMSFVYRQQVPVRLQNSFLAERTKGGYASPGAVGALFLCSVVVGEVPPIPGTQDMRDPGVRKTGCITAKGSEGMLVVFKDFQAIPTYLLSMGPRSA